MNSTEEGSIMSLTEKFLRVVAKSLMVMHLIGMFTLVSAGMGCVAFVGYWVTRVVMGL